LDRHDISLQFELVEINDYMKQLVEKYAVVAASKEIDMQFVPCKEPCFVNIDTVEFAGAFTRLLENAIIYTEEDGSITVHVNVQNGMVNIAVQDTGIGIAEKDLPRIFERFYRADQARSARTGGHGLGLAIAQSVIEAHGGSIIVKSSPDEGSTFTVTLLTGTAPSVS
jgi:two-component system phosphate regulon sensor histidine kinase PhoR